MTENTIQENLNPPLILQELQTDPILTKALKVIEGFTFVQKVILFGSRARGTSNSASDYDICVVSDDDPNFYNTHKNSHTEVLWDALEKADLQLWTNERMRKRQLGNTVHIFSYEQQAFELENLDPTDRRLNIRKEGLAVYSREKTQS